MVKIEDYVINLPPFFLPHILSFLIPNQPLFHPFTRSLSLGAFNEQIRAEVDCLFPRQARIIECGITTLHRTTYALHMLSTSSYIYEREREREKERETERDREREREKERERDYQTPKGDCNWN